MPCATGPGNQREVDATIRLTTAAPVAVRLVPTAAASCRFEALTPQQEPASARLAVGLSGSAVVGFGGADSRGIQAVDQVMVGVISTLANRRGGTWIRYDGERRPPVTDGPVRQDQGPRRRLDGDRRRQLRTRPRASAVTSVPCSSR